MYFTFTLSLELLLWHNSVFVHYFCSFLHMYRVFFCCFTRNNTNDDDGELVIDLLM